MQAVLFTLSISLFDSLATTQQIIIFVLLLTTHKPLRNSIAYLAGLSGSYFICGGGGFMVLDRLRVVLDRYFPSTANMSNALYYTSEFFSDIIMIVIGVWYYYKKRNVPPGRSHNMILAKLKSMNAGSAFTIGILISVTSFPVSVPYILALEKYAALHMSFPAALGYILLYNIGYALPMLAVLVVYLHARKKADDLSDTLHEKVRTLNVQLTTWAFAGVGIFSVIDSAAYFIAGHALVKGRFL